MFEQTFRNIDDVRNQKTGRRGVQQEPKRKNRAAHGEAVIKKLAEGLNGEFGREATRA